jgi:hypothetical protein
VLVVGLTARAPACCVPRAVQPRSRGTVSSICAIRAVSYRWAPVTLPACCYYHRRTAGSERVVGVSIRHEHGAGGAHASASASRATTQQTTP